MKLFEDDFGIVTRDMDKSILTLTWTARTSNMEDEDFQNSNMALAVLSDEHKSKNIIVDVREFGHNFGPDLSRWRIRNVLPIYARAGVNKMAFLHGSDYGGPTEGGMPEESFATGHFGSHQDAIAWLMD